EELTLGFGEITFPPVAELKLMQSHLRALLPKAKAFHQNTHNRFQSAASWFSGEHSWPIGEVPLEITIGIMVSTIYGDIKIYTPQGIGIIFSMYESDKAGEGTKKLREVSLKDIKGILSCTYTEERIVVNSKYPEQTVVIRKKLLENFKERLQDLLRSNADVFAWTHADMTRILRTITVGGKPFNTEHKLNEYMHIKPVKQKKRGLGPNRNATACKEVEEPMKAGILQKVKIRRG
ncbi:hypothetical protein Tco_0112938, partial [Tanacetum coccineum]